jgi:pyruvate/2-oxoglutarate dehydrogenase complex dihydrolipoamide dehydrogenase (E3) component
VTAAGAAGLGARVALVERHRMGGDCLNTGCVPSKAVIAAGRAWHAARTGAARFGAPDVARDAGSAAFAFERMRAVRADLAHLDGAERFRGLGVDVFFGSARFEGRDVVRVDAGGDAASVLRFRRAVIASGARAVVPPVPGLADLDVLTHESVFDLAAPPRRLLVVGAGPIGCELAQAFARLGSEVTVLDAADRPLAREDADAAAVVQAAMARDGVRFVSGVRLTRATRVGDVRVLEAEQDGRPLRLEGDAVLVAVGRRPNVEGLGLDAAGVAFDARRGVQVDARLRTSNPRVLAVGDVAVLPAGGPTQFTHAADAQARVAIQNALFFGRARADRLVIPRATYTSPELASVGRTAAELTADGVAFDAITVPFAEVDRAVLADEAEGFLRVLVARGSDRLLGVTIVGADAGDLVAEAAVAMTNGLGLAALGRTIHPYPTRAEVFRKAADRWRRGKLTPRARALLGRYLAVFRALT